MSKNFPTAWALLPPQPKCDYLWGGQSSQATSTQPGCPGIVQPGLKCSHLWGGAQQPDNRHLATPHSSRTGGEEETFPPSELQILAPGNQGAGHNTTTHKGLAALGLMGKGTGRLRGSFKAIAMASGGPEGGCRGGGPSPPP
ncbi:unnamed protein product [Eretmochelys imbricata]